MSPRSRTSPGTIATTAGALLAAGVLSLAATAPSRAAGPPTITGTKVATANPTSPSFTALEGGATDGTYWYSAVLHNRRTTKVDPTTKKRVTIFYTAVQLLKTPLHGQATPVATATYPVRDRLATNLLGHANAMTYDAEHRRLVIPAWTNDASRRFGDGRKDPAGTSAACRGKIQACTVQFVDPTSLRITGGKQLARPLTSLCYDAVGHRYVGRQGGATRDTYTVYDADLALRRSFSVPVPKAASRVKPGTTVSRGVSQSADCDERFIYLIRSANPAEHETHNIVYVYDYTGRPAATYAYATRAEGEHLTHDAGAFYAGFNIGDGQLYELDRFRYTATYDANGGTGSMPPTVVLYGHATKLRENAFTRPGSTFVGWTLRRSQDGAVLYVDPADAGRRVWLTGPQPAAFRPAVYRDRVNVARTITRGTLTLTAVWKP